MATERHEFQSHNSPWTEVYETHCYQEEMTSGEPKPDSQEEQQPTRDALADVYNRRDTAGTTRRRF